MTSQLFDTTIFIVVAFWGIVPAHVLGGMIISQYVFKLIIALFDTPFAYLLVKWARSQKNKKITVAV